MKARKIISALLAALMLLSVLTVGIHAAEDELPFTDVKKNWSYESIKYVYENGIMNGTGGTAFSPDAKLTRAMVVTVMYRNSGSPETDFEEVYADVKENKFYSLAVVWAKSNNIVTSTGANDWGEDLFSPDRDITRQELATMFKRYADHRYVKTDNRASIEKYPDHDKVAKNWALEAVQWAVAEGLINGKGTGDTATLSPTDKATRAEFAAIIKRFNESDFDYMLVYNSPVMQSHYTEPEYPLVDDADIYVAVDGNDVAGDGTLEKPYATFAKAAEEVRRLKATAKDEIVVAFKAGNYGNLNVTLTEEDAGSTAVPVKYCAYGDGDVVFSNGIEISLNEFTPIEESDYGYFPVANRGNIYKADLSGKTYVGEISSSSQLYNGNERMSQARFPNKTKDTDQYMIVGAKEGNKKITLASIFANKFDSYHTYEGITSVGPLGAEYLCHNMIVDSYDKETKTVKFTKSPMQGIDGDPKAYFQNISEELDVAGEFWVDVANKVLYVYKPDTNYVLSTTNTFVTFEGADHISFVGIDFKHCLDYAFKVNADYVKFDRTDVFGVQGEYTFYVNGSHFELRNSELTQLDGGGLIVYGGDWETVTHSENTIENNAIHHYNLTYQTYKPAVRLMNSVGTTISHNEIYHATHSAIIYGQAEEDRSGRAIENVIEYNYIHDTNRYYGDAGAIYAGRTYADRDNVIRYNVIDTVGGMSWGIYLDDGLSSQHVIGNIFCDPGGYSVLMSGGRDNTITGNLTIGTSSSLAPYRIWAKYAEMLEENGYEGLTASPTWPGAWDSLNRIPAEGTEGRKTWEEKWPELFESIADLNITPERLDDYNLLPNSAGCVIKDNYSYGKCKDIIISSELATKFNVYENNPVYKCINKQTNEVEEHECVFVNPALGDYRVKDGADFADNHFEKIGRY